MRSAAHDTLPPALRRALEKLGHDLGLARRRRRLTVAMVAERMAVSKATYGRVERGDPTVSLGVYAMALHALGFGDVWSALADSTTDEHGLALEEERLPRRVRVQHAPTAR